MEIEELQKEILKLKEENEKLQKDYDLKNDEYTKLEKDNIDKINKIQDENKELREHNNYLFRKVTFDDTKKQEETKEDKKDISDLVNKLEGEI